MIENKTKHTFIVTIDAATMRDAMKNNVVLEKIEAIINGLGMDKSCQRKNPHGMYYTVTHTG